VFNSEYTITWDEISPSLQLLFKTLQSEIVDNHNKIMKNRDDIEELDKRILILENNDPFSNLWLNGQQGQVVKINKKDKKLYPHDEWLGLRVVDNNEDLQSMKKSKPNLIDTIRDTWEGYAHYNKTAIPNIDNTHYDNNLQDGQNLAGIPYTNYTNKNGAWSIDNQGIITCNSKTVIIGGFKDPKAIYSDFDLEYEVSVDNTSAMVGILLGFYTDDNGVQHTLSFIRGPRNDSTNNIVSFALVYDLGNDTQEILSDHTLDILDPNSAPNTKLYARIKASKKGTLFKLQTTLFDPNKDNIGSYVGFDFEFNVYTGSYTKEVVNSLLKIINNPTPIGILVRNTTASFKLISQKGILDNDDIYDLSTNKHYTYDYITNAWKEEGTIDSYLSNRIFLYNKDTKKFFFYNYPGTYTEMDLFQTSIFKNATDGQVIKLDKAKGKAYPNDEFHILCGYLTAMDKKYIQDNMVSGKIPKEPLYDFQSGKVLEYKNAAWVEVGNIKDRLAPKTLVYNKILKKLFFYKEDGIGGNNVVYIEF
jgi:hypothetical protein